MTKGLFRRAVLVTALSGCRAAAKPEAPAAGGQGQLAVEWTGAVARSFAAPAEATWCRRDTLLEVMALASDTAVGLAFVMTDSIRPGQHPVTSSTLAVNWRPAGLAALRWANDTAVRGFEGNSGNIAITEVSGGRVSGTIDVRLKLLETADTVRMRGRFSQVPVVASADSLCGRVHGP